MFTYKLISIMFNLKIPLSTVFQFFSVLGLGGGELGKYALKI